eukprot:355573_1
MRSYQCERQSHENAGGANIFSFEIFQWKKGLIDLIAEFVKGYSPGGGGGCLFVMWLLLLVVVWLWLWLWFQKDYLSKLMLYPVRKVSIHCGRASTFAKNAISRRINLKFKSSYSHSFSIVVYCNYE